MISWRSLRYQPALYVGAFIALALATTMLTVTLSGLAAVGAVPDTGGPVIVVDGRRIARDAPDLGGVATVLALSGAVSAFVSVLVVGGTFAFGVALRRRQLALLRLIAATRPQVRRMVIGEAVALAVPAAALGGTLGALASPAALRLLFRSGLSPVPLPAGPEPRLALGAGLAGVVVAVLGAWAAAGRAARVRPVEALRDADLDRRVMTVGRWLGCVPLSLAAVFMLAAVPGASGEAATPLAIFGGLALTAAAAAFGPVYLPPLARLIAGWSGLAAASLAAGRRRTAALIVPVLSVTAVTGVLGSVLVGTAAAVRADQQAHLLADVVLDPPDPATVDRLRASAEQVVEIGSVPAVVVRDGVLDRQDAVVADLPDYAAAWSTRLMAGQLEPLGQHHVAVSQEYASWFGYHVGGPLRLALFDGRTVELTVAAVIDAGAATPPVLIAPALTGPVPPTQVLVRLRPGAPVEPTANLAGQDHLNLLILYLIVGPAAVYGLVAAANVVLMGLVTRRRELAVLRMLGAGRTGVTRLLLTEATVCTLLGGLVAAAVTTACLLPYRAALRSTYVAAPLDVPWPWLVGLVTAGWLATVTTTAIWTATSGVEQRAR